MISNEFLFWLGVLGKLLKYISSEYFLHRYYILTTKANAPRAYSFPSQHFVTKRRVLTLYKISPWLDIHV
ncbi:hypothetical protein, partial [Corynebacterium parakroppenstedtii]|uniref:hypothetical protein n=1 Tax=Corynebacterium parakroppenstedtii TaxID=2828363 RepID=UPI0030EB2899